MNSGMPRLLGALMVLLVLGLAWELLSHIVTAKGSYDEPLVPGWGYLFGNSLLRMSDYWGGGFGVPVERTEDAFAAHAMPRRLAFSRRDRFGPPSAPHSRPWRAQSPVGSAQSPNRASSSASSWNWAK